MAWIAVMAAILAMATTTVAALSTVSTDNATGKFKQGAELKFKGTPLTDYGVEGGLTSQTHALKADKDGYFSVGAVAKTGAFTVKVSTANKDTTKAWLALVSKPDLVGGDFAVDWVALGDVEDLSKNADGAFQKVWDALLNDGDMRAQIWKAGSKKYLSMEIVDLIATTSTCVALTFIPAIGTGACVYAFSIEFAKFLRYVVEEAVERLNKANKLLDQEYLDLKKLLNKVQNATLLADLAQIGLKPSAADVAGAVGTVASWASDKDEVQEILQENFGDNGRYVVQVVKAKSAKYSLALRVLKLKK
jgi:hypothetical protein